MCTRYTLKAPLCREELGCVRTSLRSAMVRFMPASCFHTGSARFRLRGLPVRIAMPRSTPADTARQRALRTDQTWTIIRHCAVQNLCSKTAEISILNEACWTVQARCFISENAHEAFVHFKINMRIFSFCLSRINTPEDLTGRLTGLYLGSGTCSCEEGTWLRGWAGNSPCWRLTRRGRWGWRWAAGSGRSAAPHTFRRWTRCSLHHSHPRTPLRKETSVFKTHSPVLLIIKLIIRERRLGDSVAPTHKFDLPHSMREQQAVWAERTHFGTHLTKYRLGSVRTCKAPFATGTLHLQGEEEKKKKEIMVWFVSVLCLITSC